MGALTLLGFVLTALNSLPIGRRICFEGSWVPFKEVKSSEVGCLKP